MQVLHKHTWAVGALLAMTLLSLPADAHGRSSGEPQILGPGGESAEHTTKNHVQVWACHSGKMNTCVIRSEGGGNTPGRLSAGGHVANGEKIPKLHLNLRKNMKMALAKRRHSA